MANVSNMFGFLCILEDLQTISRITKQKNNPKCGVPGTNSTKNGI